MFLTDEQNIYVQNNIEKIHIFEKDNSNVPNDYKNKSITSIILKKQNYERKN